jgi:hypothetical protein
MVALIILLAVVIPVGLTSIATATAALGPGTASTLLELIPVFLGIAAILMVIYFAVSR